MKIRKVSADLLDARSSGRGQALSPRAQKRARLESTLHEAIQRANAQPDAAFLIELEADEKPATVRQAFQRVKSRSGANEVNLFARDGLLLIAKRPQTRGRRSARSAA
jgi:cyanophycinase-like exopeptidase